MPYRSHYSHTKRPETLRLTSLAGVETGVLNEAADLLGWPRRTLVRARAFCVHASYPPTMLSLHRAGMPHRLLPVQAADAAVAAS
jgi:hypothetical protein